MTRAQALQLVAMTNETTIWDPSDVNAAVELQRAATVLAAWIREILVGVDEGMIKKGIMVD